jgi:AcrR family transcriptional regulator
VEPGSTRERLLDAAEALFAERGFDGASMRAVTTAAGVSLSAANYHFGSKTALLRETLRRRIQAVNGQRLERLERLASTSTDGRVAVEDLLEAFLRPTHDARVGSGDDSIRDRLVIARLFADPPEIVAAMRREFFEEVNGRFVDVLHRSLPSAERRDVRLAFDFAIGVMIREVGGHIEPHRGEGGFSDEVILRRMIAFVAAGLRSACGTGPT